MPPLARRSRDEIDQSARALAAALRGWFAGEITSFIKPRRPAVPAQVSTLLIAFERTGLAGLTEGRRRPGRRSPTLAERRDRRPRRLLGVLGQIYEVGDSRDLPVELQGESGQAPPRLKARGSPGCGG
jgi:hypothetical protein